MVQPSIPNNPSTKALLVKQVGKGFSGALREERITYMHSGAGGWGGGISYIRRQVEGHLRSYLTESFPEKAIFCRVAPIAKVKVQHNAPGLLRSDFPEEEGDL
jgi:hypothetical protein